MRRNRGNALVRKIEHKRTPTRNWRIVYLLTSGSVGTEWPLIRRSYQRRMWHKVRVRLDPPSSPESGQAQINLKPCFARESIEIESAD